MYQEQINRIKTKLKQAKEADKDLKAFGAGGHEYHLNPPVSEKEIVDFENKYGLRLPECYRQFLLQVGDENAQKEEIYAGPYYGNYALGYMVSSLIYDVEKDLKNPCILYPKMSDEYWDNLCDELETDDDQAYEEQLGKIYGGLLPLGSQGCTYEHALVLNGEFAGRVVNVDLDHQKPKFSYEKNFLDWYERYLDEVISGDLMDKRPRWFGYQRGESVEFLMDLYQKSTDADERKSCLGGILYKRPPLVAHLLDKVELFIKNKDENQSDWIGILILSSYERAKPYLLKLLETDKNSLFKFLNWYAKDYQPEWIDIVKENLHLMEDEETFRFATYTLTSTENDFGEAMLPFIEHKDKHMRCNTFYTLGKTQNKEKYIDAFIKGLQDEDNDVLRHALQAIGEMTDERFLPYYKAIALRFPKEKDYILSNLSHRLKPYGLTIETIKEMEF